MNIAEASGHNGRTQLLRALLPNRGLSSIIIDFDAFGRSSVQDSGGAFFEIGVCDSKQEKIESTLKFPPKREDGWNRYR